MPNVKPQAMSPHLALRSPEHRGTLDVTTDVEKGAGARATIFRKLIVCLTRRGKIGRTTFATIHGLAHPPAYHGQRTSPGMGYTPYRSFGHGGT